MLEYFQALEKIKENAPPPKIKLLPLYQAMNRILAKDLYSRSILPSFDNSAVDGYAIRLLAKDLEQRAGGLKRKETLKLKLQGEIPAGANFKEILKSGHAVRVYTGASVPLGTQTVVMQENTERLNGHVVLLESPKLKENIRFRGEDVKRGELLLKKGTPLRPVHLALLASCGYAQVPIFSPPAISILVTGDELVPPGTKLKPGKIHDSNSILLEALIQDMGASVCKMYRVGDNKAKIQERIRENLKSDVLIISGGVSVGDYDFVKEVLKEEGVKEIFWKVNIKPGKPLFFGKRRGALVFGLPGNPVSVYITFQEFVRPVLMKMLGRNHKEEWREGRLTQSYRNGHRWHFVRVLCDAGRKYFRITPLKRQGSHMVGSLAKANAILRLSPHQGLKRNQCVSVKMME